MYPNTSLSRIPSVQLSSLTGKIQCMGSLHSPPFQLLLNKEARLLIFSRSDSFLCRTEWLQNWVFIRPLSLNSLAEKVYKNVYVWQFPVASAFFGDLSSLRCIIRMRNDQKTFVDFAVATSLAGVLERRPQCQNDLLLYLWLQLLFQRLLSFTGGGGGFSAKFWVGVCRPQFQNRTVG